MKVNRQWLKDCGSEEDKQKRVAALLKAKNVLALLEKIVQDKLQSNYKLQEQKANYESPSWSELQADYIGTQRTLRDILDLLNFKEER